MFTLYKIYYKDKDNNDVLMYLGKTTQRLTSRLHNHFFKDSKSKVLNLNLVSKIEYAECNSLADLNVMEIYYINLLKPLLNIDCKSNIDNLTIELPDLDFKLFMHYLINEWKHKLKLKNIDNKK